MYSILVEPEDMARHAREYQMLVAWFSRRQHELGLSQFTKGDPWIRITPITKRSMRCVKRPNIIGVKNEIIGHPPCNFLTPSFK